MSNDKLAMSSFSSSDLQLPFFTLELKVLSSSENLSHHIAKSYARLYDGIYSPNFQSDCMEVDRVRQWISSCQMDKDGADLMLQYARYLISIRKRFSLRNSFEFKWMDVVEDRIYVEEDDPRFELCCMLFNLGATFSLLGSCEQRTTDESARQSLKYYQLAAGAFAWIKREIPVSGYSMGSLDSRCCTFLYHLLMAQAQQCVVEKSVMEGRRPLTVAKLLIQLSNFYRAANELCQTLPILSREIGLQRRKDWTTWTELRIEFYRSIAMDFAASAALTKGLQTDRPYGLAIFYETEALEVITRAVGLLSKIPSGGFGSKETIASVKKVSDCIQKRLEVLKKTNQFIYNERVATSTEAPVLNGVCVVQEIDPNSMEVTRMVFEDVMPIQGHQLASFYSEEKAKISRDFLKRVENANKELADFLSCFQLDDVLRTDDFDRRVPDEMYECFSSASSVGNAVCSELTEYMKRIADSSSQIEKQLSNLRQSIKDPKLESMYRSLCDTFETIKEINASLESNLDEALPNLRILAKSADFSVNSPVDLIKDTGSFEFMRSEQAKSAASRMYEIFRKIDQMREQRNALVEESREKLRLDSLSPDEIINIARKSSSSSLEANLAEIARQRSQPHVEILNANLNAQANVIEALSQANLAFAPYYKRLLENLQQRENRYGKLIKAWNMRTELKDKCKEALECLDRLSGNIKRVEERIPKEDDEKRLSSSFNKMRVEGNQSAERRPYYGLHTKPAPVQQYPKPEPQVRKSGPPQPPDPSLFSTIDPNDVYRPGYMWKRQ